MSRSRPAEISPRPPDAEWTEEDVLFVVTDVLTAAPKLFGDEGFEIARGCLKEALEKTREIHTDLGYPDGFDPHTYALIFARGAFGAQWYFQGELENAEVQLGQVERLNQLLEAQVAAYKAALDERGRDS